MPNVQTINVMYPLEYPVDTDYLAVVSGEKVDRIDSMDREVRALGKVKVNITKAALREGVSDTLSMYRLLAVNQDAERYNTAGITLRSLTHKHRGLYLRYRRLVLRLTKEVDDVLDAHFA